MHGQPSKWLLLKGFMIGLPVGCLSLGFIFYPPVSNWGEAFSWDKLANWLSALGSAGAAIGAVWIASSEARRRRREDQAARARKAALVSAEIVNSVVSLRIQLVSARSFLELAREQRTGDLMVVAAREARLEAVAAFPRGSDLDGLPVEFAVALASARASADGINTVLDRVTADTPTGAAVDVLRKVLGMNALLDGAHKRLDDLARVASTHGINLSGINFLDRGDGTAIVR